MAGTLRTGCRAPRSAIVVVAVVIAAAALGVTACGGSSSARSSRIASTSPLAGSASTFETQLVTYRRCLKQHGVLPLWEGGRFSTIASRVHNPAYTAVLDECGAARLAHTPWFGDPPSKAMIKVLDAYVACVVKHGYMLPTPNTSGKGPVFPPGVQTNIKYRAAAKNCVSIVQSAFLRTVGTAWK